jgi:outer membrane protein insertion porin family
VALALPGSLRGQGPDPPEVKEVRFRGNDAVDSDDLAAAIVTRETDCRLWVCWWKLPKERHYLNRRELPLDLARIRIFYLQRGYREAQVDTTVTAVDSAAVEVVFTIEEGRPVLVDSVQVTGQEGLQIRDLTERLPLQLGDPLNILDLDASRDTILTRLRNNGYAHAEVLRSYFIPADDPHSSTVTIDLYPGNPARFGEVSVEGADELSPLVVERMLPFAQGDPYSQQRLFQGQRNLFGLELVRHANIQPDLTHVPDTIVPVHVVVNEGDVHRIRGGVGYTSAECLGLESRWTSRNFQGGGRRLQITGRLSNILTREFGGWLCPQAGSGDYSALNWLASAEFTQPWLFSSRNALTLALYAERASVPDIFIRRAVGLNVGLARTTPRRGVLTFSYRPQRVQLDAAEVYFCGAFLVCDAQDIQKLQEPNWLSPLGVNYQLDRQDQPLNPSRGYTLSLDYELAGGFTLSDFAYQRLAAALSSYTRAAPSLILAGRVRGGYMRPGAFDEVLGGEASDEIVHPEKRFFSGGANSVRGFAQNQLGPRNLSVGVADLILPSGGRSDPVCTPEAVLDLTCDANPLDDDEFDRPLPVGGTLVLEANFEARIETSDLTQLALFTDVGQVWEEPGDFSVGDLEVTPGAGIRILTPIGPVRFDVAYNFRKSGDLPVVTELIREAEEGDDPRRVVTTPDGRDWYVTDALAALDSPVLYPTKDGGALPSVSWRRFQLHLTIGHAF